MTESLAGFIIYLVNALTVSAGELSICRLGAGGRFCNACICRIMLRIFIQGARLASVEVRAILSIVVYVIMTNSSDGGGFNSATATAGVGCNSGFDTGRFLCHDTCVISMSCFGDAKQSG